MVTRFRGGFGLGRRVFGLNNEFNLRAGLCDNIDELGYYVNADVGLGKHLVLSPHYRTDSKERYSYGLRLGLKF